MIQDHPGGGGTKIGTEGANDDIIGVEAHDEELQVPEELKVRVVEAEAPGGTLVHDEVTSHPVEKNVVMIASDDEKEVRIGMRTIRVGDIRNTKNPRNVQTTSVQIWGALGLSRGRRKSFLTVITPTETIPHPRQSRNNRSLPTTSPLDLPPLNTQRILFLHIPPRWTNTFPRHMTLASMWHSRT